MPSKQIELSEYTKWQLDRLTASQLMALLGEGESETLSSRQDLSKKVEQRMKSGKITEEEFLSTLTSLRNSPPRKEMKTNKQANSKSVSMRGANSSSKEAKKQKSVVDEKKKAVKTKTDKEKDEMAAAIRRELEKKKQQFTNASFAKEPKQDKDEKAAAIRRELEKKNRVQMQLPENKASHGSKQQSATAPAHAVKESNNQNPTPPVIIPQLFPPMSQGMMLRLQAMAKFSGGVGKYSTAAVPFNSAANENEKDVGAGGNDDARKSTTPSHPIVHPYYIIPQPYKSVCMMSRRGRMANFPPPQHAPYFRQSAVAAMVNATQKSAIMAAESKGDSSSKPQSTAQPTTTMVGTLKQSATEMKQSAAHESATDTDQSPKSTTKMTAKQQPAEKTNHDPYAEVSKALAAYESAMKTVTTDEELKRAAKALAAYESAIENAQEYAVAKASKSQVGPKRRTSPRFANKKSSSAADMGNASHEAKSSERDGKSEESHVATSVDKNPTAVVPFNSVLKENQKDGGDNDAGKKSTTPSHPMVHPYYIIPHPLGMANYPPRPQHAPYFRQSAVVNGMHKSAIMAADSKRGSSKASEVFAAYASTLKAVNAQVDAVAKSSKSQVGQPTKRRTSPRKRPADKKSSTTRGKKRKLDETGEPNSDTRDESDKTEAGPAADRNGNACDEGNSSERDGKSEESHVVAAAAAAAVNKDETQNSNTAKPKHQIKADEQANKSPPWYPPEHPNSKFPTLNRLSINLMDRTSVLGQIRTENVLREIVKFKQTIGEELTVEASNSKGKRLLVSIPVVNHKKAFYKRAKNDKWIENILRQSLVDKEKEEEDNTNDAIYSVVQYLVNRHRNVVLEALGDMKVLPSPLDGGEVEKNKSVANEEKLKEKKGMTH